MKKFLAESDELIKNAPSPEAKADLERFRRQMLGEEEPVAPTGAKDDKLFMAEAPNVELRRKMMELWRKNVGGPTLGARGAEVAKPKGAEGAQPPGRAEGKPAGAKPGAGKGVRPPPSTPPTPDPTGEAATGERGILWRGVSTRA